MRPKWLEILLLLSLAINAGVLATTGYYYYRNASMAPSAPCPVSPGDGHLYQSLGLSDTQSSKMEPLAQKFHGQLGKLGAEMEERKRTLVDLLQKEGAPESVESLRKEMAGIQDEIQKEVIAHISELKKILNPKQQELFFDLMRENMTCAQSPSLPAHGGK
jgi:Spy/CpxP family protein refolding chaperone